MNARDLAARVEFWRKLIAPEWRIQIEPAPPTDVDDETEHNACVAAAEAYLFARLWVREAYYRDEARGEVDVTIVHELLHLLLRELRRTIDLADGMLHRDVLELLTRHFETEEERFVERAARLIARLEHPDGLMYGVDVA